MSPATGTLIDDTGTAQQQRDDQSANAMKSLSEGELGADEVKQHQQQQQQQPANNNSASNEAKRSSLKRTLTLPRILQMSRTRRARQQQQQDVNSCEQPAKPQGEQQQTRNCGMGGKKVARKASLKESIKVMKQYMSSLVTHSHKGGQGREGLGSSAGDIRAALGRPAAHVGGGPDSVPGVVGLRNHGNTCFMNAVLQCLSHTDILAEYFVLDQYKADLSRKKNSKKYGTKGEITEQLALLLKAIWYCKYDPEMSTTFKSVVDKYGSQYRGNLQHDAQEFLLWLLDKVHEDLNQATNKKYKIIKNSFNNPEIVAAETWANHKRCNNSFVHEVFQAQFRSSLTCPRCQKQSNTFDPFLCVSVPVPQARAHTSLFVNVLYTSQQPRQVRIGVSLGQAASVRELREALASDTGIAEEHMLLTEVHDEGFHRTFSDCQPLSVITENDPLYCIELPQLKEPAAEQAYVLLVWVNVLLKGRSRERFGSPYTMQVARETSYRDLQKLLLKEMHASLADEVLTASQEPGLFDIRVADPAATPATDEQPCIDPGVEHPLYVEQIEQALALCADDSGPPHVKLVLEWDESTKANIIHDDNDPVEEHASVKQLKNSSELGTAVTLEECFELYTRAETLGVEDAWHCPHCNRKQEVVKKLGLWSLPSILVIHLKRFRQQSKQRSTSKLTMLVNFPLYGFDMTPHLARSGEHAAHAANNMAERLRWSWNKPRLRQNSPKFPDENVYDLYAICNHHGQDLQGGHYTALCRNPYDSQWYCFDDTRVEAVEEKNLVTNSAYILFYQKRSPTSNSSTGNSSSASTSSAGSGVDHWVAKMPPKFFSNNNKNAPTGNAGLAANNNMENNKHSKSQETLCQDKVIEEKNMNNFNRRCRNYSTLPPVKRSAENDLDFEDYLKLTSEADAADYEDEDDAPVRIEWTAAKPMRKNSSISLSQQQASPTIAATTAPASPTKSLDRDTAIIHESTL